MARLQLLADQNEPTPLEEVDWYLDDRYGGFECASLKTLHGRTGTLTNNEELRGDPRSIPEDAQFPEGWHRAGLDPHWP